MPLFRVDTRRGTRGQRSSLHSWYLCSCDRVSTGLLAPPLFFYAHNSITYLWTGHLHGPRVHGDRGGTVVSTFSVVEHCPREPKSSGLTEARPRAAMCTMRAERGNAPGWVGRVTVAAVCGRTRVALSKAVFRRLAFVSSSTIETDPSRNRNAWTRRRSQLRLFRFSRPRIIASVLSSSSSRSGLAHQSAPREEWASRWR